VFSPFLSYFSTRQWGSSSRMSVFRTLEQMRHHLVILLMMASFAGFLLQPAFLVLCLQTDGCVTLESSRDGRSCGSSASSGHRAEHPAQRGDLEPDEQHCEVCTDLPIRVSMDRILPSPWRCSLAWVEQPSSYPIERLPLLADLPGSIPPKASRSPRDTSIADAPLFLSCVRLLI
jgi:hypothetical protein